MCFQVILKWRQDRIKSFYRLSESVYTWYCCLNIIIIIIIIIISGTWAWTQGNILAKPHPLNPFYSDYFWDGVLCTICGSCPQTTIVLISVSQVARIICVNHWHTANTLKSLKRKKSGINKYFSSELHFFTMRLLNICSLLNHQEYLFPFITTKSKSSQ
jgi:hypothetical protein